MQKQLVIIGAGSVGGHIANNLAHYGLEYKVAVFLDDDTSKIGSTFFGHTVLGPIDMIFDMPDNTAVVIGIAFPNIKRKIIDKIRSKKTCTFPTLISPCAWISDDTTIGMGSIIYPNVSINYGSTIGDFVVINMNCAIGHDCAIDNYSCLAPGVSFGGFTHVEASVDVGIGVSTIQNVIIGSGSIIGGQTMLIKSVEPGTTVAGVPGRKISR